MNPNSFLLIPIVRTSGAGNSVFEQLLTLKYMKCSCTQVSAPSDWQIVAAGNNKSRSSHDFTFAMRVAPAFHQELIWGNTGRAMTTCLLQWKPFERIA
jgi:hypothetical protein